MADELLVFHERPAARCMIAGWRQQWSDAGEVSGGLPQHLIDRAGARKVAEMARRISTTCYPFQIAGTHDASRPGAAYHEGLPSRDIYRDNSFYDAGSGVILFLGEEPWFDIDLYGEAFFLAIRELGVQQTVAVESYYGAAPPELERRVSCIYSGPHMKEQLERYGVSFSSYGEDRRSGPTIGMALVTLARYYRPDIDIFRLGAMVPMYPFVSDGEQVGLKRDHTAFYDILRRLRSLFKLDIDLTELKARGDEESRRLHEILEKIAASNPRARQIIDEASAEFRPTPYEEPVELSPALDQALEDIMRGMADPPDDSGDSGPS